jgi:hypothetical protein
MAAGSVSLPPAAADFSQKASRRARASALSGASGMVGTGVGGRVTTCKSEPKKCQKKGAPPRYYTVLVQKKLSEIQRSHKQAWRQCAEQLVRCTLLARARCQSRETRESRWVRWERRLFTPPSTMLGERLGFHVAFFVSIFTFTVHTPLLHSCRTLCAQSGCASRCIVQLRCLHGRVIRE